MVFNLVMACFLFLTNPRGSYASQDSLAAVLAKAYCKPVAGLPDYPTSSIPLYDLAGIACACGSVVQSQIFSVISHCPVCAGKSARYWAATERGMLRQALERKGVPRIWTEYACSIAIHLNEIRRANLNSVTAQEN